MIQGSGPRPPLLVLYGIHTMGGAATLTPGLGLPPRPPVEGRPGLPLGTLASQSSVFPPPPCGLWGVAWLRRARQGLASDASEFLNC